MSDSKLVRLRDGLLRLKKETDDRNQKIRISELLDIIDEADREDAGFAAWCEKHAPDWEATDVERKAILAFLASDGGELSREVADSIVSKGEAAPVADRRSSPRVRNFFWKMRKRLEAAGSTVEISAGRDGVYRTTDPTFITLREVSPPGDR